MPKKTEVESELLESKRTPSTIPLSNGLQPYISDSDEEPLSQENWSDNESDGQEQYEIDSTPQVIELPSQAEFNAEVVRQVAKSVADDATSRQKVRYTETAKAQKDVEKLANDQLSEEKAELARKLNGYRKQYKGDIQFPFKAH